MSTSPQKDFCSACGKTPLCFDPRTGQPICEFCQNTSVTLTGTPFMDRHLTDKECLVLLPGIRFLTDKYKLSTAVIKYLHKTEVSYTAEDGYKIIELYNQKYPPMPGNSSSWYHVDTKDGPYRILHVTCSLEGHSRQVVYSSQNGKVFSVPLSDWYNLMTENPND